MADLPTNFLDDILSASMGGKRRFKITHLNGTSEEVTIEDVSEYDQYGSKFGAGDINKTNQAVNEKFDSEDVVDPMLATKQGFAADAKLTRDAIDGINSNLNGITFGYTEDGKAGVIVKGEDGADSVIPFIDTSNATATADLITEGYTAWVNGKLIVGTRPFPSTYQSGYYVTERLKYGASATYRVNFEKAFVSPPTVVVSSDNGNIRMSVSGTPTTTYFNLYCINQGNGSSYQAGCTWKATGTVAD